LNTIAEILIWAIPVILAITLHEAAHGYVARYFGDPTAGQAGRITLNPIRHIDPIGTIAVPLCLYLLSGGHMLFGWAKPVPVNFSRLRNPKANMLWVAAAGPLSNLAMAIAWALVYTLVADPKSAYNMMAVAGMLTNGVLMFLNLVPIPPLDGGRIAVSLLPVPLAREYARLERFGFPILLILLATGVLGAALGPLLNLFLQALIMLFGG
jgi:Zn-dependent protease